jgi:hypothetical protein
MTEKYGNHGLRSQAPNNSEVAMSCDLAPNQIFEHSDRGGEISKEKSPLRLCTLIISDTPALPKIATAPYWKFPLVRKFLHE